jgi:peptidoglycan/xylan/chitin deacetylase (PgdA/CDA1 family)
MKRIISITVGFLLLFIAAFTASVSAAGSKLNTLPTTYPAVVYAFGGLSNPAVVQDVLERMDRKGIRGTFFVTERELQRNGSSIAAIAAHHQEIGIGLRPGDVPEQKALEAQIDRIRQKLANGYGVSPTLVRQMYGAENPAIEAAVAAKGCKLIGQTKNIVLSKLKDAKSVDEVMGTVFKKWDLSLGRGQIAYFRLDYFTDPSLAGKLVEAIKEQKVDNNAYRTFRDSPEINPQNDSAYQILSVGDVLAHKEALWSHPVPAESIPQALQPSVIEAPVTKKNFNEEFLKRYIGAPEVDEDDRMYGLDQDVIRKADKSGVIKTVNDNTIFLTFDDWGTDNTINKLLYVLRKHHVPGTFFIITKYMPGNPNLLRAIALEGNEIGSHTDLHKAMAIRNEKGRIEYSQSPEDYRDNVAAAYRKLAEMVGDVKVNGRYALTRFFRPPTLAISDQGAMQLFNSGYTYLVSGYKSTEDYAVYDLTQLVGAIRSGIYRPDKKVRRGAVIIMHMSATAKYTAEALDIVLSQNELLDDTDPRKFKVGYLSDYLKDGYDQRQEQKKY